MTEEQRLTTKEIETMTLTRHNLVKYERARKWSGDYRRKKACAVFEYMDENYDDYRKAFWLPAGTDRNEFFKIAPLTMEA